MGLASDSISSLTSAGAKRRVQRIAIGRRFLQPDLVSQVMVRRMKKAGIAASIHSLRHSHAAILLSRGVPLPAASARITTSSAEQSGDVMGCHNDELQNLRSI
jgi:integrase